MIKYVVQDKSDLVLVLGAFFFWTWPCSFMGETTRGKRGLIPSLLCRQMWIKRGALLGNVTSNKNKWRNRCAGAGGGKRKRERLRHPDGKVETRATHDQKGLAKKSVTRCQSRKNFATFPVQNETARRRAGVGRRRLRTSSYPVAPRLCFTFRIHS